MKHDGKCDAQMSNVPMSVDLFTGLQDSQKLCYKHPSNQRSSAFHSFMGFLCLPQIGIP